MRSTQQFFKPLIAIIMVILISGNLNPSFGQGKKSIKKTFEIANQYFSAGDPDNASVYYQQILDIDSSNAEASYKIAECYRQMRNFSFALTFYDHAFQQDPAQYKDGLFYTALMEKYLGNYPEAIKNFDHYLEHNPSDVMKFRANFEKNGAQLALDQSKKPEKNFQFDLVPRPVSTKYDEMAVVLAGDDQHVVVHIDRNGLLTNQQFERSENQWIISGENTLFNTLNADKQVGSGTFNHTKNIFYFSKADSQTGNSRLYQSSFQNGTWQPPSLVELEYIDGPYHYEDPCLTPTGDTLIFSSDIPGGMGGYDLWYVTRDNDGNWGIIENLNEPINTAFDEKSPFYFPLQNSLFFSSNGHVGYGNFDIFFIKNPYEGKEIVNIGAPFNSPYNDQSMVLDGEFGFMASDRTGGNGGFDIYTFRSKATQFENYIDKAAVAQKNLQPENGNMTDQNSVNDTDEILKSSVAREHVVLEDNHIDTSEMISASLSPSPNIKTSINKDEDVFQTSYLEISGALKFYENLTGKEKKFADRIIALRNVNEQYVLHPGLSNNDRQYYLSLPHVDQLKIQRLAQFFEFGNNAQQAYNNQDLTYLRSLDSKDRNRVLRIATRLGLGMDQDNYVAFSDRDWNYYKKIPEDEITEMKTVAHVLKDNGQSFSLTLTSGFIENDPEQPVLAKYQPREESQNEAYTTEQSSDIAQQPANSKSDENGEVKEDQKTGGNGMFSISVQNNQKNNGDIYHMVKDGETVRSIAKKYDKKPRILKELNNIKGNKLKPGIKLLIEKHP